MEDLLVREFAFDQEIAHMVLEDWDERDKRQWPEDEAELDVYISSCGGTPTRSAANAGGRMQLVAWAAGRQFAMLLEAALLAELSSIAHDAGVRVAPIERLLMHAQRLAGSASPFRVNDAPAILRQVAREWLREEPWTVRDHSAEVRARLRQWMTERESAGQ
ncbi:MAG: hypothetical protein KF901_03020 [Myxococcales bacterium]|nr:hypothetical protein [Labilithrix sp.]MBX3246135.1 hypothetical protein [Myxococcales bacterium]